MSSSSQSTKIEDGVARSERDNVVVKMAEGEKLLQLLKSTRREQAELAKAAKVTKAAVYRWVRTERFSKSVWAKVHDGLKAMGLNPQEVRPDSGNKIANEDLTRLVVDWTDDHLRTMQTVLEADFPSRDRLLAYISGALRRRP